LVRLGGIRCWLEVDARGGLGSRLPFGEDRCGGLLELVVWRGYVRWTGSTETWFVGFLLSVCERLI
jgi:hypothetical protein